METFLLCSRDLSNHLGVIPVCFNVLEVSSFSKIATVIQLLSYNLPALPALLTWGFHTNQPYYSGRTLKGHYLSQAALIPRLSAVISQNLVMTIQFPSYFPLIG